MQESDKRLRIIEIQNLNVEELLKDLQNTCSHNRVIMTMYEGMGMNDEVYRGTCLLCGKQEQATDAPLETLDKKPILWASPEEFNKRFHLHYRLLSIEEIERLGKFEVGNIERVYQIL